MNNLKLVTAPATVLSTRAKEVASVDLEIQQLMDNMLELMYKQNGIGLAANQVGVLKRVVVLDLQDKDSEYKDLFPLLMANPKIIFQSDDYQECQEGCLSLPGQTISISRPEQIEVEYLDYNNKLQKIKADGLLSRAIQHEIDHINGKLLINYLSNLKRSFALKKLSKIKNNLQKQAF